LNSFSPNAQFPDVQFSAVDLECVRGFHSLFSDLDFSVGKGTALQIEGANGSGKTSLLRILCGLSLAETGEIFWNGVSIKKCAAEFRGCLGYLGHKPGLKPDLTPTENLQALGRLNQVNNPQYLQQILQNFAIGRRQNRPCRQLSAGQNQRIGIARVVLSDSPLWILDEPVTSLDTAGIDLVTVAMQQHLQNGGLIIFTSHQTIDIATECLQVLSLDQGIAKNNNGC
jgi:heme exporter protein A